MRPPEPLGAQHQQQRALTNERQGVSRTVVLCPEEGNDVIAYACLSAGALAAPWWPMRCGAALPPGA